MMARRDSRRTVAAEEEFPDRPVPAVGAIVFRKGEVLLVKRGDEPNAGPWSLPGGLVEIGETVESAAVRETLEETRVRVRPVRLLAVSDFLRSEDGRIRWHFVLIDLLCDYVEGNPFPGRDETNARFIPLVEVGEYDVAETALDVVRRASALRK